mgnify:FL=1
MSRGSVREYVEALRERYRRAGREDKGRMLDEFTQVTGYHRKAAIRLLTRRPRSPSRRRGRQRQYGPQVTAALRIVWEAADRVCSRRLHPFLAELVPVLERQGHLAVAAPLRSQLLRMSPATMDRLLRPARRTGGRRPHSTTRPGSLLKGAIPIRTFADWNEGRPGFLEADLVAHCGESSEGFSLTTLSTVDVATGWVECQGVWGKGQERVGGAVHHLAQRLPFPLLGLDTDNGSEFINQHLYAYCQRHGITFTRSRPYKKNDSAHVEQKNGSVVRRLVGYDRYSSRAALEQLNRVYNLVRLYGNFFQPVMKLHHKTRHGAKVHKVYDTARTPYRRLLESGALAASQREALTEQYQRLDPIQLLSQINQALERLWTMAEHPDSKGTTVTPVLRQLTAVR